MKYLVTGAAGFIGAAVAEKLMAEGNIVVTIDNLRTGYKEHVPQGVDFINGSTADVKTIEKLKERGDKFDAILHIAGQSSGEISFEDPVYDLQTNAQSTVMLLKYAYETGCKKFIYASTMSVYGDHNPPLCDEKTELLPRSFYAVGKIASEKYMRIYSEQYGMTCTALRLFNTYGVGQNLENLKQGMVSIYLALAMRNHKITVKGCKDRFRDFVYIDDVVKAFIMSLRRETGYEFFNVCTGIKTSVEQVVNLIRDSLPYKVDVEYIEGTPGDQFGIIGDNNKIEKNLGWTPSVQFKEGVKRMIDWAITL